MNKRDFLAGAAALAFSLPAMAETGTSMRVPATASPGPIYDFTIANYSQLSALLTGGTDLSNKTVLIAGDCQGTAITIASKSWPNAYFLAVGTKKKMPRLYLNAVTGAGSPIRFYNLDFYNVYSGALVFVGDGQINFQSGTSSHIWFDSCLFHDDPFATKSFVSTYPNMYQGITSVSLGICNNLTVTNCEIYNQTRSILRGNNVYTANNLWHDHYYHAATILGSDHTHRDSKCWNLWAAASDSTAPHAGVGFSPSPPTGGGDMSNVLLQGIVAIPGVVRFLYDGQNPGGSGFKFNDMYATGYRYVNCRVIGCLVVGTDSIMCEMDAGTGFTLQFNTFVHDEAINGGNKPSVYINDAIGGTVRNNIFYSFSYGAQGRGTFDAYWNAMASPDETPAADNLLAYTSMFVGSSFSGFATPADAIAAFTLNPTHPAYSWPTKPGAVGNYDFNTGTLIGTPSTLSVSSNVTSITNSLVNKPNDAWLRTPLAPTATGTWAAPNARTGSFLFDVSNDASIDAANKYLFYFSSGNRGYLQRRSTRTWRFVLFDASGLEVIDANSTIETNAASGLTGLLVTWDLTQARLSFVFRGSGKALIDQPIVSKFRNADAGYNASRQLTLGTDNLSTTPGNNWVGQFNALYMEDQFSEVWNDAGLSRFFNTTGGIVNLGADGSNPFGSKPGVYIYGNASAYNAGNFNLGDGMGGTGNLTPTVFNKGGTGSFS